MTNEQKIEEKENSETKCNHFMVWNTQEGYFYYRCSKCNFIDGEKTFQEASSQHEKELINQIEEKINRVTGHNRDYKESAVWHEDCMTCNILKTLINKTMTKEEHKASDPSADEMRSWNKDNEDKYTKEEHTAGKPSAYGMRWWNNNNEDKYTEKEINDNK